MRLTLVEANSLTNIRAGEGRLIVDSSEGKTAILDLFIGKPVIKLNLLTRSAERIAQINATNTKRYVGVTPLEVDFYSSNWNNNVHLTAIYALLEEEPRSRIYIFATQHKVDPVKLARELMQKLALGQAFNTEYPVIEIKQAPHRRLDFALREPAYA